MNILTGCAKTLTWTTSTVLNAKAACHAAREFVYTLGLKDITIIEKIHAVILLQFLAFKELEIALSFTGSKKYLDSKQTVKELVEHVEFIKGVTHLFAATNGPLKMRDLAKLIAQTTRFILKNSHLGLLFTISDVVSAVGKALHHPALPPQITIIVKNIEVQYFPLIKIFSSILSIPQRFNAHRSLMSRITKNPPKIRIIITEKISKEESKETLEKAETLETKSKAESKEPMSSEKDDIIMTRAERRSEEDDKILHAIIDFSSSFNPLKSLKIEKIQEPVALPKEHDLKMPLLLTAESPKLMAPMCPCLVAPIPDLPPCQQIKEKYMREEMAILEFFKICKTLLKSAKGSIDIPPKPEHWPDILPYPTNQKEVEEAIAEKTTILCLYEDHKMKKES